MEHKNENNDTHQVAESGLEVNIVIIEKSTGWLLGWLIQVHPNYVQLENVTNMDNQDLKTMVDRGRYFSIFALRRYRDLSDAKTAARPSG